MTIRDRFTRGWVSGACGGILGSIISIMIYNTGISTLRLSDWSAIMVYGRIPPYSLVDQIYALLVLAGSMGVAGIVFAFLMLLVGDENIYFKGWIIFLLPWQVIYLLTALAKTEGTLNLSVATTLSDGIATSIIGLTAVYFYRRFEPKK